MKSGFWIPIDTLGRSVALVLALTVPAVLHAAPYAPNRSMSGLELASPTPLSTEEQVRDTLSRYTRAIDTRDLEAYLALFAPEGRIDILQRAPDGVLTPALPPAIGREAIAKGAAGFMQTRQGDISHHFTHDLILSIDGETARINAQFLVTHARLEPRGIVSTLTGYYNLRLRKVDGRWLIVAMEDIFDLPWKQ